MGTTSRQGPSKPPICVLHAPSIYALQGSMMFGSYMIQISIHRRKRAWILKSPLGGEPSTDTKYPFYLSVQFSSVTQSCPTLCDPMNHSMPGLPVHHQLPESTQTHVHWAGDAIQSSHPLSSPSPPALNLSQHQGLFKWVSSSHQERGSDHITRDRKDQNSDFKGQFLLSLYQFYTTVKSKQKKIIWW